MSITLSLSFKGALMDNQNNSLPPVSNDTLWYLNNYILLKDYLDRTISRIAARCVRKGNIAIEEYPFYAYILDVLEEITEDGDFILAHPELFPYVNAKIKGGMSAFRKDLESYRRELTQNSTPEMVKDDAAELQKMKEALGNVNVTKEQDPTVGAGMNMDQLMEKLLKENNINPIQEDGQSS